MRIAKPASISRLIAISTIFVALAAGVEAQSTAPNPGNTQQKMTIKEAEQIALQNNPSVSVSKLLALAEGQVTREVRSNELPNAVLNLTAVEPHTGSRLTAGGLNNPIVYERAAGGVTVSQLITDFGRSRNLVASAQLRQKAANSAQLATAEDIILSVDQAFYAALRSQALLRVAEETVNQRQVVADQVQALTNAKLKSDLDLSFANVNLSQAKLLLLDAQNQKDAAFANLNTVLGYEKQRAYLLVDETGGPLSPPPQNSDQLLTQAFQSRPDLAEIEQQWQASERYRRAEHDLFRPTISALAAVGDTPVRPDVVTPWYGAVGVNLSFPIFNGFDFSARAKEADYRAAALKQRVRDVRDRIARDVQVTWMSTNSAYQKLAVTAQLLQQANLALDLANTRYTLGLGSIVELSQAQLQQTEAAIGDANARYAYQQSLAELRFQTGQ
jgi:outer membrane protein